MAQPQQQYPMAQPPFSPSQSAASPATPQQFPFPPSKRQRLSPNPPSQPTSPYVQSPYGMSPGASGPPSAGASPHFANVQLPPNVYNTPYSNGHTAPTLSLPQSQPPIQNQPPAAVAFPNQGQGNSPYYSNYAMAPQGSGTMGPPSKPQDKSKEESDVMDVLGGTGIDIREEEQYLFNSSFNNEVTGSRSGTFTPGRSFTQFPPGDQASFYGAGPANAPAEAANTASQDEFHKKAADKAWHDAARNLAVSREREINRPFLELFPLQRRVEKITSEHGVALHEGKNSKMGHFILPDNSNVAVQSAVGPKGALTATNGTFLPADTQLCDQVALLSLATKYRLRSLLEDSAKLAKGRQTGSHGHIPDEWVDVAEAVNPASSTSVIEGGPRAGWESAVSPRSNPLKRSFSSANKMPTPVSDGAKTPTDGPKITNEVASALRSTAQKERDYEEARLRKRQGRTPGDGTPRQSSVAPGTPGSVAPEAPEKGSTKKEQGKKAQAKANEAASHAAANVTTATFLGGGGGLFGKKKKYSWMTGGAGGGSASGASTPGRITTQGLPATPGAPVASSAPEKLTVDGVKRMGTWREDQEKGKGIQIRDWVAALEQDGREKKALQRAYMSLDLSEPK